MILQHNQPLDPSSLVKVIREPILTLINQIAGIQLEPLSAPKTVHGPSVRFSLKGDLRGHIVLIFESPLSQILAERLLHKMGLENNPEFYLEALGELGNILLGHIDGKLDNLGMNLTFSTPETTTGPKHEKNTDNLPMVSFLLYSVDGAMEIALYLIDD